MLQKRIFVVTVGFESNWIIKAIKKLRPDKLYLLEKKGDSNPKYLNAKKEVVNSLKKIESEYEEIILENKDDYFILKTMGDLVKKEKKNHVYLNLCSGNRKIPAIFVLSSFLFKSINPSIELCSFDEESEEIIEFPSFKVNLPEQKLIEALREINIFSEGCTKVKLCEILYKKSILSNKETYANKLMNMNRNILQKLIDWKFIEIEGKTKKAIITITEEGKKWLKFM